MKIGENEFIFMEEVGRLAKEDWQKRHICLPSLVTALAIEGSNWGMSLAAIGRKELFCHRDSFDSFRQAIETHNDYLATWKERGQEQPNWKNLIGQENYILAAQFLQNAKVPYSSFGYFESQMVFYIEEYNLARFDGYYVTPSLF